jgi:hypothetical protein
VLSKCCQDYSASLLFKLSNLAAVIYCFPIRIKRKEKKRKEKKRKERSIKLTLPGTGFSGLQNSQSLAETNLLFPRSKKAQDRKKKKKVVQIKRPPENSKENTHLHGYPGPKQSSSPQTSLEEYMHNGIQNFQLPIS